MYFSQHCEQNILQFNRKSVIAQSFSNVHLRLCTPDRFIFDTFKLKMFGVENNNLYLIRMWTRKKKSKDFGIIVFEKYQHRTVTVQVLKSKV